MHLHDSATGRSLLPWPPNDTSLPYIDVQRRVRWEWYLGLVGYLVFLVQYKFGRLFRPRGQLVGGSVIAEVFLRVTVDFIHGICKERRLG